MSRRYRYVYNMQSPTVRDVLIYAERYYILHLLKKKTSWIREFLTLCRGGLGINRLHEGIPGKVRPFKKKL